MHRPFAVLEDLLREGRIKFVGGTLGDEQRDFAIPDLPTGMADDELFGHAMQGVRALGWSAVPLHHRPPLEIKPQDDEAEALRVLEEFLKNGDVEVDQTPEYIERAVHPHGRLYLQDLHAGRFSVQAWLDLHGMNQNEARYALDDFILASVRASLSCVRVIHGRGRHSHKKQPILKDAIQRWLCSRRLGRHVVAYTSARLCDGGGGAVYVLLRG
jgi:DNA-nicking Smr family endonuclease